MPWHERPTLPPLCLHPEVGQVWTCHNPVAPAAKFAHKLHDLLCATADSPTPPRLADPLVARVVFPPTDLVERDAIQLTPQDRIGVFCFTPESVVLLLQLYKQSGFAFRQLCTMLGFPASWHAELAHQVEQGTLLPLLLVVSLADVQFPQPLLVPAKTESLINQLHLLPGAFPAALGTNYKYKGTGIVYQAPPSVAITEHVLATGKTHHVRAKAIAVLALPHSCRTA